jgi:hypothetical protein
MSNFDEIVDEFFKGHNSDDGLSLFEETKEIEAEHHAGEDDVLLDDDDLEFLNTGKGYDYDC